MTRMQDPGDRPTSVRVDVWLWAVRVFKTRSAATTACRAGHVKIDGTSVKAAQPVRPGQRVTVRRPGHEQLLEVVRLLTKRVGAPVAATAYVDHSAPRPPAQHAAVPRRDRGAGRPTKKDRREMDRLRGH